MFVWLRTSMELLSERGNDETRTEPADPLLPHGAHTSELMSLQPTGTHSATQPPHSVPRTPTQREQHTCSFLSKGLSFHLCHNESSPDNPGVAC